MKLCLHSWKPAYWRNACPSYKRCVKCGKVKTGSKREQKKWKKESPWRNRDKQST